MTLDRFDGDPGANGPDDYLWGDTFADIDETLAPDAVNPALSLRATPFVWVDPRSIPPRPWVLGRRLCRGFVSSTIAPGGVGKTTLGTADALALTSGRDLIGERPHAPARVWLWAGEDPREEAQRRITAAALHYGLVPDDFVPRLMVDSGRDAPIRLAEMERQGAKLHLPTVEALERIIRENRIDVVILDPFVQVHGVEENSNGAVDMVVKALAGIAGRTGCAVEIIHHSRKLNGAEADADSARGGSAIVAACRSVRALNPMPAEVAKSFDIAEAERRQYVRVDDAKANLAPPISARWLRLVSFDLDNATADRPGDSVGVVESWTPPDPLAGIVLADLERVQREIEGTEAREDVRALKWVGHTVGRVLNLDSTSDPDLSKIKFMLKAWIKSGALRVVRKMDDKGKDRPLVVVGEWASAV